MKKWFLFILVVITVFSTVSLPAKADTSVCVVTVDSTKGVYNKEVETVPEVPPFSWEDNITIIVPIVATEEDIKDVEYNQKTLTAKIEINKTDYEDIKTENPELNKIEKEFGYCLSMDITFSKIISTDAEGKDIVRQEEIHDLSEEVTLSFEAPSNFDPEKQKIECTMVRIHEGKIEKLDLVYHAETHTLSFKTDRFSDYIFYYQLINKETPKQELPQNTSTDNNYSNNDNNHNENIIYTVVTEPLVESSKAQTSPKQPYKKKPTSVQEKEPEEEVQIPSEEEPEKVPTETITVPAKEEKKKEEVETMEPITESKSHRKSWWWLLILLIILAGVTIYHVIDRKRDKYASVNE